MTSARVRRLLREVLVDFDAMLVAMDEQERRQVRQDWPSIPKVRRAYTELVRAPRKAQR